MYKGVSYKFSKRMTNYVVIYDIISDQAGGWTSAANKRRNKITRILYQYGVKVQRSVFEVEVFTATEFRRLLMLLERNIFKVDRLFVYPIDKKNYSKVKRIGIDNRNLYYVI